MKSHFNDESLICTWCTFCSYYMYVRWQGVCVGVASVALVKGGNRYSRDRVVVWCKTRQ